MKSKKMACCWLGVAGLGGQKGAWGSLYGVGVGEARRRGNAVRARESKVEMCIVWGGTRGSVVEAGWEIRRW